MNFVYKVLIFVFAILAVASASPAPSKTTSSAPPTQTGCSSGSLQCCQSLLPSSDSVVSILLGLLGIVLDSVTGLVGVTCSPINLVGITGVQCASQTLCCENATFNGILAIDCSPINIAL